MLAKDGILHDVAYLDQHGIVILDNIAPTNPKSVLKSIRYAGETNAGFFESNSNSDGLIKLLRSLAYDPHLFDDSVTLIAHFARSKTESNNMGDAVNVFKSLFYIHLSGTHASAIQRAEFIRTLSKNPTEAAQALVLIALDAMLECSYFSSGYRFEFGTRKRDYGFRPSTIQEQRDWYTHALLLAGDLATNALLKARIKTMIASQFRYLASCVRLDDLTALSEILASDGGWPEGWAGVKGALRDAKQAGDNESFEKLLGSR